VKTLLEFNNIYFDIKFRGLGSTNQSALNIEPLWIGLDQPEAKSHFFEIFENFSNFASGRIRNFFQI
jgi:hypothetical protein